MTSISVVIPARAGSKGLKNKNFKQINGAPLIYWTIHFALAHFDPENIIVSSDSPDIVRLSLELGLSNSSVRPKSLSGDLVRTSDVVKFELKRLHIKPEWTLLLQPTSPLRISSDLTRLFDLRNSNQEADAFISINKIEEPHPYKMFNLSGNYIRPLFPSRSDVPRQSLPNVYAPSGLYYFIKTSTLFQENTFIPEKTAFIEIPTLRAVNINTKLDFDLCEHLLKTHDFDI